MPLRCINAAGEQIHSFALDTEQWALLKAKNRAARHLRMPCCSEGVVLKTSSLGTRFFAHSRRGDCTTKPESAEHLMLKGQVAIAIAAAGWEVATEVRGHCREGLLWIADVMATRGDKQFAVEIQWSKQSWKETVERHFRYSSSGVRCLWLFRQSAFNDKNVPAVTVAQDQNGEFVVPMDNWQLEDVETVDGIEPIMLNTPKLIPIKAFITRVFSGRHLWFGTFRQGHQVKMTLYGGSQECMTCSRDTMLIYSMSLTDRRTNMTLEVQPYTLALFMSLLSQVNPLVLEKMKIGPIKAIPGNANANDSWVNRCFHCSAAQSYMASGFNEKRIPRNLHSQQVVVTHDIEIAAQHRHVSKWRIDMGDVNSTGT